MVPIFLDSVALYKKKILKQTEYYIILMNIDKKEINSYCNNCNIRGHSFNNCIYPIVSIGIVSFINIDNTIDQSDDPFSIE